MDSYNIYFNHEELHFDGENLYPQFGKYIVKLLLEFEEKILYNNSDHESHQKVRKIIKLKNKD